MDFFLSKGPRQAQSARVTSPHDWILCHVLYRSADMKEDIQKGSVRGLRSQDRRGCLVASSGLPLVSGAA